MVVTHVLPDRSDKAIGLRSLERASPAARPGRFTIWLPELNAALSAVEGLIDRGACQARLKDWDHKPLFSHLPLSCPARLRHALVAL